jgi:hypothetical protein
MNQEIANKIFETDLGRQINCFYYTSDDRVFIRREEAEMHTNNMINGSPEDYINTEIKMWFNDK